MFIVTGASGTLGSLVVDQLLARVPAERIGVSVRDPDKVRALAHRGVRVRHGDFDEPSTLADAFAGATDVLIISAAAVGELAVRRHATAIEAAKTAGARRIVYTSHMGAGLDSAFAPMPAHARTEALLGASGVPFVALRNGFYAASGRMVVGSAAETSELAAPADGPVSWTAHADLAEAAAIVLTEPERLTGVTPPLTAGAALDLADLARIASERTGRPIRRVVVDDVTYRERMLALQLPAPRVELLLGMFRASRAGEFAAVDPTLARLLGRAPRTMHDLAWA
ncbi:NAD(P)H-binding protein [Nannocystis punicea]|uniref:NAD(P)H-binding protein n=1 Tax=Nannocystis punicea TaxID=2995304 RepID=A0ABY7GXS4_9BACT|nr:NAD(P)H-binding protein [Nannocystis poenicansa]WAS91776.1 NAD(P)H-binding protein [Nannocystis poenicansa]